MFSDKNKAISILNNGVYEGARYKSVFVTLAKYFKYLEQDKTECKKGIIEWLEVQCCDDIFDDVMQDMNDAIEYVYKKDRLFVDDITVHITMNEMVEINKLEGKGAKIVMFAMIYLSKIYSKNGSFYCIQNTIAKTANLSKRNTQKWLYHLEGLGYISVPVKNRTRNTIGANKNWSGDKGKRYSMPNRYKVEIEEGGDVIYTIKDVDNIESNFIEIYKKCISSFGFEIDRKFKRYISNDY